MFVHNENDEDILGIGEYTSEELLEYFGHKHLIDAVRIIATRKVTINEAELVHEALCILVSIYVDKYQEGEIEQDTVLH